MAQEIIKPRRLRPGDTIGVVSPASAYFPALDHHLKRGIHYLESLDLKVQMGAHALEENPHINPPAQRRADDIHAMFSDPDVSAVLCLSGGSGVNAVLPLLDWGLIAKTPKIVMGYSANTALLMGLYSQVGLVSFHGPTLLYEFGEYPEPFAYTRQQVALRLFEAVDSCLLQAPPEWTDAIPDEHHARPMKPNPGWRWLRPGRAQGRLLGGNLSALLSLAGTRYWPCFRGAILCLEEVNMGHGVLRWVDGSLAQCRQIGVFDEIAGLVVGKINELRPEEEAVFESLIQHYTRGCHFPIVMHVDFGHTDPRLVLPFGIQATLDADEERFSLDESPVL
jgi:muramoyltetrapeptide carboxypeptidase